jgi:hypothetical protein
MSSDFARSRRTVVNDQLAVSNIDVKLEKKKGHVYCADTPACPGYCKVGYCTTAPSVRLRWLSSRNKVTFRLCWYFLSADAVGDERLAHATLGSRRKYNPAWRAAGATEAFTGTYAELIRGLLPALGRARYLSLQLVEGPPISGYPVPDYTQLISRGQSRHNLFPGIY